MQAERITELITQYKSNKGRLAYLCVQISDLEDRMQKEVAYRYVDEVLKPAVIDGMPHGNQVGRPTENIAVRLADQVPSASMREMQSEYAELCSERRKVEQSVRTVDAWMQALNDKQSWVLRMHMIENVSWRELTSAYHRHYGEWASKDTLKRIKQKALDKISEIAG